MMPGPFARTFSTASRRQGSRSLSVWPLLLLLALAACATPGQFVKPDTQGLAEKQPPDSLQTFALYLIGDAGYSPIDSTEPALRLLQTHLDREDSSAAVVFLGDNIYPSGLPPVSDPSRKEAERLLNEQIKAVQNFKGQIYFIPGNHDYGGDGLGGERYKLRAQEVYVERALNRGNTFIPDRGFPGPHEVELADDLVLVGLDTQWWMESTKQYGDTGQYELEQEGEFLLELHNVLRRHTGKQLVIVGHHPIFTNGSHGGRFSFWRRLLPLPIEYISRAYLGTPQDISNLKYRRLRTGLRRIFEQHDGLVYAAGHDHNLQYFLHRKQHYIISGSGSKVDYVAPGYGAAFARETSGWSVLRYYRDGSVWLEFLAPVGNGSTGESLYLTRLREGVEVNPEDLKPELAEPEPEIAADTDNATNGHGSSIDGLPQEPYRFTSIGEETVIAASQYRKGAWLQFLLGRRYRDIWGLPVEVPVIDLRRTAGGLRPIELGGGFQTLSLQLKGGDGDEYVLRSIVKDPAKSVPPYLRETIAQDVLEDQMSAVHPFGAFIIPRLATAAGIYHTTPRLVYVPDDPRLGAFREQFGGTLALFESRPDEDQSDEARFGYAKNVVGSPKMLEEVTEDNDDRVDERAFARARLFDMLVGDWDRHLDQWRWSEFETEAGKRYRPIPRDRDFAFFQFDGLLSKLTRFTGVQAFRRFTNFTEGYNDLFGLNYNGMALDRRFTTRLTEADWVEIADSIRAGIPDEVIEEAISAWPATVQERQAETFTRLLRERRDELPRAAARYARMLAESPDVVGSDKHERFEVHRLSDDSTRVVVFKTKKEGDVVEEIFRRTFRTKETAEIRLYGLDGNDQFVLTGSVRRGPRVRAIGGGGQDVYIDSSSVGGGSRKNHIYDTESGNIFETGRETRTLLSNNPLNNEYLMGRLERDLLLPTFSGGFNADDQVLVGAGAKWVKAGFRKSPYAAMHQVAARFGAATQRVDAFYRGRITDVRGDWDGRLDADLIAARDYRHFYGLGNETERSARDLYQAQFGQVLLSGALERRVAPFTTFQFGPRFEFANVDPRRNGVSTGYTESQLRDKYFLGAQAAFNLDGTDTLAATQTGVRWLNHASVMAGVRNTGKVFSRLSSEMSYFYTFDLPIRTTLAFRVGGATNLGKFEFYQANTLGGESNLRGFRRTRFSGRSSVYTNAEVRARLVDFNAYIARGYGGVLAFVDNGRVWADNERSDRWHQSVGGGVWISPFYQLVIAGTVGVSRDDTLFDVSFGFLF